ncbi:hypothetical protein ISS07_01135 [Candidatus Woesearchaeota archaeon]|nr:hypothetical protein [Candidatus Woesearchaeota archaeon]
MSIVSDAFEDLFPDKNIEDYSLIIKYSGRFKPYNANVRYRKNSFTFNLSKNWKTISREIQIGLLQSLFVKVFKKKKTTFNIDLYNNFMKKIHIAAPKTKTDPILRDSFDKVNEKYFHGLIEPTNFVWHNSTNRLGSYEYGSDTVSISKILLQDPEALDYVMHHEMLHKKLKFNDKNGSCRHHTPKFKKLEKKFHNSEEMENRLKTIVRNAKRKKFLLF